MKIKGQIFLEAMMSCKTLTDVVYKISTIKKQISAAKKGRHYVNQAG